MTSFETAFTRLEVATGRIENVTLNQRLIKREKPGLRVLAQSRRERFVTGSSQNSSSKARKVLARAVGRNHFACGDGYDGITHYSSSFERIYVARRTNARLTFAERKGSRTAAVASQMPGIPFGS